MYFFLGKVELLSGQRGTGKDTTALDKTLGAVSSNAILKVN